MKFDTQTEDNGSLVVVDYGDDLEFESLECWALDELSDVIPQDCYTTAGYASRGFDSVPGDASCDFPDPQP